MIDKIVINEQDLTEKDYRNMFINCSPISIDIKPINTKPIDTETIKTEAVAFDDFSWSENEKQAYDL